MKTIIDGPHGVTCVVSEGESLQELAGKHAKYLEGLFRRTPTLRPNADGSLSVIIEGYDTVTFAREGTSAPAAPPAPRPTPSHESIHRYVRLRRGK